MLDAKDVLDYINDKWDIIPRIAYYLPNGNFESGSLFPWEGTGEVTTEEKYEGNYSCKIQSGKYILQEFSPFSKSIIKEFGFFIKGISGLEVTLTFSDDTSKTSNVSADENWEYVDLLTLVINPCTGELLFPNDKSVVSIKFESISYTAYIDNVILNIDGELYLALDEFNPNNPKYQLVFINRPARTIFLSPNVLKVEQDIVIECHTKLIQYKPDVITTIRDMFTTIKGEVKRILNVYRFDEVGSTLNMSGWVDAKLPHGFGEDKEPLELVSRMTLQIIFYNTEDNTLVGTRVHKVTILNKDLLGLIDAGWVDTDPWVMIQIPKGPIIEQNLIGPHIHGTINTHDYNSLYDLLYATEITENPNHYPINSDNTKTKFSTDIPSNPELIIILKDNEGTEYEYWFFNVRIQTVQLEKTPTSGLKEAIWVITWMADYIYYAIPE
jgi:hypothetical protein